MKLKTIIAVFLFSTFVSGQTFVKSIASFSNASSFSISSTGYIYIVDSQENDLIKYDTLGNRIFSIGGYGWEKASFDDPVDVYANTLRIYVADKNNDRIQVFDKFLNFLSDFSNDNLESDESFAYPNGFGISNQGDYFILDSDNKRVLKYDLNGNYLLQIGYTDAGQYTLSDPNALAISPDGKVFVINGNQIFVYDQYGTGLLKLNPGFVPNNINITFYFLTVNSDSIIKYIDLSKPDPIFKTFVPTGLSSKTLKIREVSIFQNRIYVLTQKNIMIYSFN